MDWSIVFLNFVYATGGAFITLLMMVIGYKVFDKITPFSTHDELVKDNRAVGMVIVAVLVGLGIAVGMVVGMGLN